MSQNLEDTLRDVLPEPLSAPTWQHFFRARPDRALGMDEIHLKKGETIIPLDSTVDDLYMLTSGAIKMIPAPDQKHVPLIDAFESDGEKKGPGLPERLPFVGARYFFTRRPARFAYVALQPSVLCAVDSGYLVQACRFAEQSGNHDAFKLMREMLINSDVAESQVPRIYEKLRISTAIKSQDDLIEAADQLRKVSAAKLFPVVSELVRQQLGDRIKAAEDNGLDASVFIDRH